MCLSRGCHRRSSAGSARAPRRRRHLRSTARLVACALGVALLAWGCKRPADEPGRKGEAAEPSGDPAPAPAAPAANPAAADPSAAGEGAPAADYGPVSSELGDPPADLAGALALVQVASGFKRPVAIEHAPGDAARRLFVVEQHVARIRILRPGESGALKPGLTVDRAPFLDLGRRAVSRGNEQGLLGLAFHPEFADNGKLYVNYTDPRGTTRVVEYRVAAGDPDRVDPATAREVFSLEQPYSNHNAGDLEFGPDGALYIGTGDGGAAGDPLGAGQDRDNLLAKMLRVSVDGGGDRFPEPEIIQIGLRNPWRYHFDRANGDLYIADVGQNEWEYVYAVPADGLTGHNFGWNVVEGNHCYRKQRCDKSGFTPAIIEYSHREGCSITGGEVYRGKAIPELSGVYFYADYCTGIIRSLRWSRDGVRQHWRWEKALTERPIAEISSFGHDHDGELYVVSLRGAIYELVRRR